MDLVHLVGWCIADAALVAWMGGHSSPGFFLAMAALLTQLGAQWQP